MMKFLILLFVLMACGDPVENIDPKVKKCEEDLSSTKQECP
jgi:hypothetical protein